MNMNLTLTDLPLRFIKLTIFNFVFLRVSLWLSAVCSLCSILSIIYHKFSPLRKP